MSVVIGAIPAAEKEDGAEKLPKAPVDEEVLVPNVKGEAAPMDEVVLVHELDGVSPKTNGLEESKPKLNGFAVVVVLGADPKAKGCAGAEVNPEKGSPEGPIVVVVSEDRLLAAPLPKTLPVNVVLGAVVEDGVDAVVGTVIGAVEVEGKEKAKGGWDWEED